MPRIHRCCPAGEVFHVLNRAVARMTIFEKPEDYDAFLRVLNETWAIVPLPILAFIAMPNHWHFVVRPTSDDQVSEFFRRLTVTHTMRWHAHYHTGGSGHLYQGRFKSFPVQADEHLLTVMRYAERNALRAGLAARSEDWRWGTLHLRSQPVEVRPWLILPSDPNLPRRWIEMVNRPQSVAEVEALRRSVQRGTPFGSEVWCRSSAIRLGLESTIRPRGRPRRPNKESPNKET
jgi:putative transposase